ncbi:hypothetical protein NDU88_002118 [Pleurodeles waltl]|uniref:Uncharacterized protein n=1 Tax=Pleurodeles waltl TaxID=8319 RepID=A0AAV7LEQ7_PLEWA|nr:hypothetical protein NDU88_002118 [Pleurodeles waltl]
MWTSEQLPPFPMASDQSTNQSVIPSSSEAALSRPDQAVQAHRAGGPNQAQTDSRLQRAAQSSKSDGGEALSAKDWLRPPHLTSRLACLAWRGLYPGDYCLHLCSLLAASWLLLLSLAPPGLGGANDSARMLRRSKYVSKWSDALLPVDFLSCQ